MSGHVGLIAGPRSCVSRGGVREGDGWVLDSDCLGLLLVLSSLVVWLWRHDGHREGFRLGCVSTGATVHLHGQIP